MIFSLGGWSGFEPDGSRHGDIRGTRLEPHEGPAGHGPRAPHWTDSRRQRVPADHQRHARGEDNGVCIIVYVVDIIIEVFFLKEYLNNYVATNAIEHLTLKHKEVSLRKAVKVNITFIFH